jgi:hypothetical protein
MLFYRQGNNNQTNQEDETKSLEKERLEREGVKRLFIV